MKKISILFLVFLMGFAGTAKADEGMWLLPLISKLNLNKMKEMGLKLSAEDIYSINNSSLKDAIVIFDAGCTGEMVSDRGLLMTNHHCGFAKIQALSSEGSNYLKDGFWARSLEEELPAEDLTVTFLKKIEDVTARVYEGVDEEKDPAKKNELVAKNIAAVNKEAAENNSYKIEVKSFFEGLQFFLLVYETYTDIRFVGAPPSSIGKFGYDTDNWMWPRHTGDFSVFRVYADKDGKPAEYSKNNVPLKPAHHLPISLKGVQDGDFAMVLGYPGSTSRYLSSFGIEERMKIENDSRIVARGVKQEIWHQAMMSSEKLNIQYASKYSRSSNYWKNSIGMNLGLERLKIVDQKRELEKQFAQWATTTPERIEEYGDVLADLEKTYTRRANDLKAQYYVIECMLRGTEIIDLGLNTVGLEKLLKEGDQEKTAEFKALFLAYMDDFFKDYSVSTDRKVFSAMLKLYHDKIDSKYYPSFFEQVVKKKYNGNFENYADMVFRKSMFADQNKLEAFVKAPKLKTLQKDPVFIAAESTYDLYVDLYNTIKTARAIETASNRLLIKGLMEMKPGEVFYPDANFSMRLSYGKVGSYIPKDGVIYDYYTTLAGVMEKYDPYNFEFEVPEKLMELYQNKDYGQYADADGTMHVCFTTDNDITGGNSGSPVINGNGELLGLAFDGNWEAMSSDITFEKDLQKSINVDIRYVLFIIDKYAGASHIIDELTLVK